DDGRAVLQNLRFLLFSTKIIVDSKSYPKICVIRGPGNQPIKRITHYIVIICVKFKAYFFCNHVFNSTTSLEFSSGLFKIIGGIIARSCKNKRGKSVVGQ